MIKWCQNSFVKKIEKKKKTQIFFMACKFVMACCDKNVIDSMIQEKKKKRLYDDMAY